MLQVDNLHVGYGAINVLRDVSLDVHPEELVSILGPNGAGKTTLLASLMGLRSMQAGSVSWSDQRIDNQPPWERNRLGLGYVPEGGRIFPDLTVEQNLRTGGYGKPEGDLKQNFSFVFELFPRLSERTRQRAGTLSGGERQMLAMARALMGNPQLLLIDEVSMGLMPRLVGEVFGKLAELREQGVGILLAEQNVKEALEVADRGYLLENGQIVMEGSAEELRESEHIQRAYLGV